MSKRPFTVKVLLALPLALTLAWALRGAAQTNPFFSPLRAGQLTGMRVEDTDGHKIGTLRNLILDVNSGELDYAVIGSGGLAGIHPTLRLAPAWVMSAATAKRSTLAIDSTAELWKRAPVFKSSSLATLGDPARAQAISSYFQQTSARNNPPFLAMTGRNAGQLSNAPAPSLKFASDLIGMRVVNQKQEKVGEVLDFMVSFGRPRPAFAVISTGRFFWGGHEYAAPLNEMRLTDNGRKLLLDVDIAAMQTAPKFDEAAWNSAATNDLHGLYRYSKPSD